MLAKKYEEEYELAKYWMAKIRRVNQDTLSWLGLGSGFLGIDPTGSHHSGWPEGYTGYMPGQGPGSRVVSGVEPEPAVPFMGINPTNPTNEPAPTPTIPVGVSQEILDARQTGISLADKGGFWELAEMIEKSTSLAFINQQIAWLRSQGLYKGGVAPAGRTSIVGERGPEPIMPMSAGIIAPHAPLDYSPGVGTGGQTINDNSQNVNADLSMLDPSQISPMQRTIRAH